MDYYVNICPVFNDYSFIGNHRGNVDSWHVHTLSDSELTAASAVSPGLTVLEDDAARKKTRLLRPRLLVMPQCLCSVAAHE